MEEMKMEDEKVLIINTGGTISMVHSDKNDPESALRPSKSWSEVVKNYQFLENLNVGYAQIKDVIDSSDMNCEVWKEIAEIIDENYYKYKGFVILHGTDTMSYTAGMLSFMLKNLGKTVILTGAQRPIQEVRSDGLQNLLTSIEIIERQNRIPAGKSEYGLPVIPEVCVFFRDYLFRGNRSRKLNTSNYFGFSSPNYLFLGEAGSKIKVYEDRLLKMPKPEEKFYVDYEIDTNVIILDIFPGFNPEILLKIFSGNGNIKGLILKTYGNGNAPLRSPAQQSPPLQRQLRLPRQLHPAQCLHRRVRPRVPAGPHRRHPSQGLQPRQRSLSLQLQIAHPPGRRHPLSPRLHLACGADPPPSTEPRSVEVGAPQRIVSLTRRRSTSGRFPQGNEWKARPAIS